MAISLRPIAGWVLLAAVAMPGYAQQIIVSKDNRTIAVTTSADAEAQADTVTVRSASLSTGQTRTPPMLQGRKSQTQSPRR